MPDLNDLLEALRSPQPQVRNTAALALRKLGDPRAVPALVAAIEDPANRGNIGTLIYALQTHDCSGLFLRIFRWCLDAYATYESEHMALDILREQSFQNTPDDLATARQELEAFTRQRRSRPENASLIEELRAVLRRQPGQ